jgi:hypothetical protein
VARWRSWVAGRCGLIGLSLDQGVRDLRLPNGKRLSSAFIPRGPTRILA